jgi:hypothetical protein
MKKGNNILILISAPILFILSFNQLSLCESVMNIKNNGKIFEYKIQDMEQYNYTSRKHLSKKFINVKKVLTNENKIILMNKKIFLQKNQFIKAYELQNEKYCIEKEYDVNKFTLYLAYFLCFVSVCVFVRSLFIIFKK